MSGCTPSPYDLTAWKKNKVIFQMDALRIDEHRPDNTNLVIRFVVPEKLELELVAHTGHFCLTSIDIPTNNLFREFAIRQNAIFSEVRRQQFLSKD